MASGGRAATAFALQHPDTGKDTAANFVRHSKATASRSHSKGFAGAGAILNVITSNTLLMPNHERTRSKAGFLFSRALQAGGTEVGPVDAGERAFDRRGEPFDPSTNPLGRSVAPIL